MRTYFLILLALAPYAAFAGGISSTGGDDHAASEGAAWFIGEKSVRYCLEVDPAFGVSSSDAAKKIAGVFSTWREYMAAKRLNVEESVPGDSDIEQIFHLGHIVMNTVPMSACDGSEDLKFYFGVTNDEVRKYITRYNQPTAFAQRTSYDEVKGWGKGFVWVQLPGVGNVKKDVWSQSSVLVGVLLHEVGHVFGNSHMGNTIMDESVPLIAGGGGTGSNDDDYFTHIDNRHELFFCRSCDFDYTGSTNKLNSIDPDTFELLTGRKPVGKVKSRVYGTGLASFRAKIAFDLSDDKGKFSFELSHEIFLSHLTMAFGDTPVFKKAVNYMGWGRTSDAATFLLSITTKRGKKLRVIMARNMGVAPLSLQLLSVKPGMVPEFFESQTY